MSTALGPRRRRRLPLVVLLAVTVVAVTSAVSGATGAPPGLWFAQAGHWIANSSDNTVYHVNGPARTVDARGRIDGMQPGSQVVQGPTSGYVVGRGRIVEFGTSDLTVEQTLTPPTGEVPVALETKGGPYLVYRQAGTIVRLGARPATITAGGDLAAPVVTDDGTLWLLRPGTNVICQLAADVDRVSCPAAGPAGHTGALSTVGRRAVFVDTDADTLSAVDPSGLGTPAPLGVDVPPTALVAGADVHGRIAIVEPERSRLDLVDASALGTGRAPSAPLTTALPAGTYVAPVAGRSSVALLDLQHGTVLTFDASARPQKTTPVPPEQGEPRLSQGEDRRIYVDGGEGRHVLVVGDDGSIGDVPLVGAGGPPAPDRSPVPPPVEPPATTPANPVNPVNPANPPDDGPANPPNGGRNPNHGGPRTPTRTPAAPKATAKAPAAPPVAPAQPRPQPAGPPGAPPGVTASVNGTTATVSWSAAATNGATITAYRVTWSPATGAGATTTSGSARSATISGLSHGAAYTITVAAQNSAGTGAGASTRVTVAAASTRSVTVSRGATTTYEHNCDPPDCAFVKVVLSGFAPKTAYQIDIYSSSWGAFNPGAKLSTDSSGRLTVDDRFPFNGVGQRVWVVVDGLESNHYLWPKG
jgi:hypothetical protein